jgi:hypothetical protein
LRRVDARFLRSRELRLFARMAEGSGVVREELFRSAESCLEKRKVMVAIKVKGGTPEGCESLCKTCTQGHIISGFSAMEMEVFCRTFYIEREIRFPVRECTFYEDRRLANKHDMEEIAWPLRSTVGKPMRNVGFVGGSPSQELENEDGEILPAASDEPKLEE